MTPLGIFGEHPGDQNHQDFLKSTAIQMGGELQYKREAYCDTHGRSTDSISLSLEPRGHQKYGNANWRRIAITNGRCIAILFLRSSGGSGKSTLWTNTGQD